LTGYPDLSPITEEALSAYVDGALSLDEAAQVARAAATVPAVAKRIAVLHQLKANVAGLADDVVLIDRSHRVAPEPRRNSVRFGIAAMAATLVVTVSAGWVLNDRAGSERFATAAPFPDASNPLLSGFLASHDAWIATGGQEGTARDSTGWLQELMLPTGLALVHHAMVRMPAGMPGQHFAFVGPNGCRLSLFEVVSTDKVPAGLEISIRDGLLAASWTEAGRGYALIARDMNEGRFMTIAAALHDASRHRGSVGEQVLAGLQHARQPCVG